jgi:hypothetical protein
VAGCLSTPQLRCGSSAHSKWMVRRRWWPFTPGASVSDLDPRPALARCSQGPHLFSVSFMTDLSPLSTPPWPDRARTRAREVCTRHARKCVRVMNKCMRTRVRRRRDVPGRWSDGSACRLLFTSPYGEAYGRHARIMHWRVHAC